MKSNKKTYNYIIEKPGRSYELARKMIPVLISWAQAKLSPQYYSTLSKTIGQSTPRIGYQLGVIGEIFDQLKEKSGEDVPYLNALVVNKGSKRPSDGLGAVIDGYDNVDVNKQKAIANAANEKAYNYTKWQWVLEALGLLPFTGDIEDKVRNGSYAHSASEGPLHNALKKYVLVHPNLVGVVNPIKSEIEYNLLSGDRLDAYFLMPSGKQVAVEVKSRISMDSDILRGIYQCVKYKAVLTAECQAHGKAADVKSILVLENEPSSELRKTANMLSVPYIVVNEMIDK